jgi:hypothetical protein
MRFRERKVTILESRRGLAGPPSMQGGCSKILQPPIAPGPQPEGVVGFASKGPNLGVIEV